MTKAYEDLLKVVQKHADVFKSVAAIPNPTTIQAWIRAYALQEEFGVPLRDIHNSYKDWYHVKDDFKEYMTVGLFGEKHNRTISWSDDSRQPEDEWLLVISFPSGPYIFGNVVEDIYPHQTFGAMFNELKNFGTAYCDTRNNNLYFNSSNAKAVYEAFNGILNKYRNLVDVELKAKRKKELEAELAKLDGEGVK